MVGEKEAHALSQEQSGRHFVKLRAALEARGSELFLKEKTHASLQERFNQMHGENLDAEAAVVAKDEALAVVKIKYEEKFSGLQSAVVRAEGSSSKGRVTALRLERDVPGRCWGEGKEQSRLIGLRDADVRVVSDRDACQSGLFVMLLRDCCQRLVEALEQLSSGYLHAVFDTLRSPTQSHRLLMANAVADPLGSLEISYGSAYSAVEERYNVSSLSRVPHHSTETSSQPSQ